MSDEKYEKEYSEEGFWDKLAKYAKKAGKNVIEPALTMYYAALDENTPMWAKTVVYGALGYFILPIDIIPDVIPVVGFTDDLATIAAALATVASYIKEEHKAKAKQKMKDWFG